MKLVWRFLGWAILAASGASIALGQSPAQTLTLADAIRLALERNPEVLVAREQLEELKGKITEVRADAYPQVSMQGFGLRLRDPSILNSSSFDKVPEDFRAALVPRAANLFDVGLTVKQQLYSAGKVGTAIKLAVQGQQEKEAALEAARQRVAFKVFQAFHDLLLAEANLEVVRETSEQRQKHLAQVRSRFTLGVATETDVLRSQVNLANMEPERIRAENTVRLARAVLNNLIVVDLDAPTRIDGKLDYQPWTAPPETELHAHALETRPEILVARRLVDEARLLHTLAGAEKKLSVDMEGRWGYNMRDPKNLFNQDFSRWNLTFNFRLPFYDGGRKLASDLGINLDSIAVTLRALLNGEVATQFEDPDGDAYDVRVRLAAQQRRSLEGLNDVDILSSRKDAAGHDMLIPVGQVTSFQRSTSSSQIRRYDLVREVRISANTTGRPLGNVLADIRARGSELGLPPGYETLFTGQAESMRETFGYIYDALILAVVFIYLILASQFSSFTHPLAIMLSLPLSLIGVVGMLLVTGDTLNIMSMIGLILLMGLVTKNAILLIDYTNKLRRGGMDRNAALGKAGNTRLRPIVMTTLAMIFGMLPLAFQIGAGSEIRAPMARAVIGGLITSTLLTLVAVPVVYSLLDDLTRRLFRVKKPLGAEAKQAAPARTQ